MYSGSQITIINNETNDTIDYINIDLNNGSYSTGISVGNYKLVYFSPGYQPRTEYLQIPKIFAKTEFVLNVSLKPLLVSEGKFYVIKNVFFDYGKYDLTRDAQIEIEKLHDIMAANPNLYVEVIGYTDSKSSADFNQKLSEKRAKSVINYLIKKGISSQRFVATGMGEANPIAINENPDGTDNPAGRKLNRRVEIKLMNYDGHDIVVEEIKVPQRLVYRNQASSILIASLDTEKSNGECVNKLKSIISEEKLKGITHNYQNGKYNYYLTGYDSKAEALKDLNILVNNDFGSAQIVEKIESEEKPVELAKQTPVEGEYTIQIKALTQKIDPKEFTDLVGIEIYKGKDGFYRYTFGVFKNREQAEEAKKEITKNELIRDAFIVHLSSLKKY